MSLRVTSRYLDRDDVPSELKKHVHEQRNKIIQLETALSESERSVRNQHTEIRRLQVRIAELESRA